MASKMMANPIIKWIEYRIPIFAFLDHELTEYPTPKNLNYWWNFGSLAGIVLVIIGVTIVANYWCHRSRSSL